MSGSRWRATAASWRMRASVRVRGGARTAARRTGDVVRRARADARAVYGDLPEAAPLAGLLAAATFVVLVWRVLAGVRGLVWQALDNPVTGVGAAAVLAVGALVMFVAADAVLDYRAGETFTGLVVKPMLAVAVVVVPLSLVALAPWEGAGARSLARHLQVGRVAADVPGGARSVPAAARADRVESLARSARLGGLHRLSRLGDGQACALVGNLDRLQSVVCAGSGPARLVRFRGDVPMPGEDSGYALRAAVSELVPGSTVVDDDIYGFVRGGRAVLAVPVRRRVDWPAGFDVPAGLVLLGEGRPHLARGPQPGPAVGRSVARSVTAAAFRRARLAPAPAGSWPQLQWRSGRPWWVTPATAGRGSEQVASVVEVAGTSRPGALPEVVVRRLPQPLAPAPMSAELVADRHGSLLVDGELPTPVPLAGGRWAYRLDDGTTVTAGPGLVTCVWRQGAAASCTDPAGVRAARSGKYPGAGHDVASMRTDELVRLRGEVLAELDRRLPRDGD